MHVNCFTKIITMNLVSKLNLKLNALSGHRKRSRVVVIPPSALGLECPSLTEVQPCARPACYTWTMEPWGACQLEPGTSTKCGTGRRTRRVACTTNSDASDFKV